MTKFTPFLEYVRNKPHLLSLQLNITNRCFSRCKSCRKYEWPKHELSLDEISDIISDAIKQGCRTVVLSGGEPLAHNDIIDICELLIDSGMDIGIITSGIIKSKRKDDIVNIIARKCMWIQVSIDSANPQKFKEIRGVDELENVIEFVKEVNAIRLRGMRPVKINTVLSKLNCSFSEIIELLELARRLKCEIAFYPVHTWKELELDTNCWDIIRATQECKTYLSLKTNFYELVQKNDEVPPVCICSQIHAVVDADGYVYPCCRMLNDNGDYDEQRMFSLGHYSVGFDILMQNAKRFFHAPTNPATKVICANCDRYVKFNKEFYDFVTQRPKLFV